MTPPPSPDDEMVTITIAVPKGPSWTEADQAEFDRMAENNMQCLEALQRGEDVSFTNVPWLAAKLGSTIPILRVLEDQ